MGPPTGALGAGNKKGSKPHSSESYNQSIPSSTPRHFVKRRTHDGANGELPDLSKELLDNLLTIFAHLDDSDALSGVQTSRHIHNIKSDPWNRIVEFEQMEQWLDALREYDLLQLLTSSESTACPGRRISIDFDGNIEDSMECSEDCTLDTQGYSPDASQSQMTAVALGPSILGDSQDAEDDLDEGYDAENGVSCESKNKGESRFQQKVLQTFVERGKLKCLLEMGHTKLAFDEVSSVVIPSIFNRLA